MKNSFALFEYRAKNAALLKLDSEMLRIEGYEPDEKVLYCYNEDTGEGYRLTKEDCSDAKFYALEEI